MDYTEVAGKVIAVGDVAVKGQYKISKLQVASKALGTVELSVFVDDEIDISVGQEIVCKVAPKDYKGKPQYSCTRKYIKVFGSAIKEEVAKEAPKTISEKVSEKVDWDSKEKRMVRMNSMSHATELVKGNRRRRKIKEVI
jgi:hypothetical protein